MPAVNFLRSICRSGNGSTVNGLKDAEKPIGVATYRIVSTLPEELQGQLPPPEEIARLLERAEE